MINICRKAFFYEQLKLGKGSFFEVPFSGFNQSWILYVQFVNSFLFQLIDTLSTHLINQTTQQLRPEAGGLAPPQIELPLLAG
jgi:hypothetical protein